MARQEKKSRMRMLPARVQLQQRAALTGSYPTNVRFSIDGRTGDYPVSYNDIYTVVFTSSNDYIPAVGFPVGNIWLSNSQSNDLTASIVTTGSVRSQIIDDLPFFHFSPGQEMSPFRDSNQPAVDGKSNNNLFYATGSAVEDVGEGFNSPLWSKNKIEIDISVATTTTLSLVKDDNLVLFPGKSYPMAYYNFTNKTWEGIERGFGIGGQIIGTALQRQPIGFINGFLPAGSANGLDLTYMGYPVSTFGFPFSPRYHATSSQTLLMSDYISEPFLLEKAVFEISAAWSMGSVNTAFYNLAPSQTVTASVTTFFLLNQRNASLNYTDNLLNYGTPANIENISITIPTNLQLSAGGPTTYVNNIRDLVGYSQIYSFGSGSYTKVLSNGVIANTLIPITKNDMVITSSISGISGANWQGKYAISMSMVTPSYTGNYISIMTTRYNAGNYDAYALKHNGFRTGAGMFSISTRGLTNDLFNSENRFTRTAPLPFPNELFSTPSKKHNVSPYLLLPGDNLILGCQIPVSRNPAQLITANNLPESTFTIVPGIYKLTLYGSYIREGREYNDGTNQLLSSDSIHEVIE